MDTPSKIIKSTISEKNKTNPPLPFKQTKLKMVDYADDTLYGEEAQEYINKLKAKAEQFLASCGKEPIEIYRIEKFEPVKQAADTHGKFYQGDSYVILKNNQKDYDIHYWHGDEATTDEMGCSAALTV